jgi:SAM-dependent methyltransferase
MSLVERLHARRVFPRRVRVLARHLAPLIPTHARVLDLGAGSGDLGQALSDRRPDLEIRGLDVRVRPDAAIPVDPYDGRSIPHADGSFDSVLLVDVLHHAVDPLAVLREAARVSRGSVLVKDHLREGWLAAPILTLMDRVGNARFDVPVTGRYWSRREWRDAFDRARLSPDVWIGRLGLYPAPTGWILDRSLHFVARLTPPPQAERS